MNSCADEYNDESIFGGGGVGHAVADMTCPEKYRNKIPCHPVFTTQVEIIHNLLSTVVRKEIFERLERIAPKRSAWLTLFASTIVLLATVAMSTLRDESVARQHEFQVSIISAKVGQ